MLLRRVTFSAIIVLATSPLFAQSPKLVAILSQLDTASAHFKSAQASVRYDHYTKVLKADDIQTGTMYVQRAGSSDRMGAVISDLGASSPSSILNYDKGVLQLYTPGTHQVQIFKAGANQAKYDSFLTLGFGGSGKALSETWDITDQGSEMLSDGAQQINTEKLDLVSKDPGVQNMLKHVTIWVDPARGVSLRQKFFTPEGDTKTADYNNIKLNANINTKPYAIDPAANRIQH